MDTPEFNYEEAIAACERGDRRALRRLYDRESHWLLGVAYRIVRDRQLAEDVVQEAFVSVWTRAATFDPALGSGRGWIYTIVRHRALREVRSPERKRRLVLDDPDTLESLAHELPSATDVPDRVALRRCLDTLDADRRLCIEAAFVEGYTQTELAELLDKPLGTIKSWIRRGLLALRECLG
ncbi:MAG: sigma-70 family RNA polymerase sigma factor [Burkholderiaceae bacterium]